MKALLCITNAIFSRIQCYQVHSILRILVHGNVHTKNLIRSMLHHSKYRCTHDLMVSILYKCLARDSSISALHCGGSFWSRSWWYCSFLPPYIQSKQPAYAQRCTCTGYHFSASLSGSAHNRPSSHRQISIGVNTSLHGICEIALFLICASSSSPKKVLWWSVMATCFLKIDLFLDHERRDLSSSISFICSYYLAFMCFAYL